ncbi:puf6 [[Candida] subhashii]|uniref:Puf6 n=1 Tax=[Candida] subhashii TaxID=561895 RepID=A0A8J5V5D6_9ASCO|nr:puf6 [[Candida] subhashii]KAG7665929.1 puf6 [[Candida] subhashii]
MAVKTKGVKRSADKIEKPSKKAKLPSPPSESEQESEESGESDISLSSEEDELDDLDIDDASKGQQGSSSEEEEDDLDDLDEDAKQDQDEDEEEFDEEDGVEKPVDPNKKSSAEQHAEQRKLLAERKLQRKSGVQVQQIKNLWEKLRVTKPTPPKEVRDKLCNEVWELSKDVINDLVLKHDASRIVQTLVKYSSKERRDKIVQSLKGNYYLLATSAYGKYLLIKLLHYGSKESRTLIIDELHGKLRKLMRHKEGAYVVEDLFVLYSTGEQRQQMIREFWGSEYAVFTDSGKGKTVLEVIKESSEKKQLIMANLYGTIKASVEKGSTGFQILHAAMREYISILVDDTEVNDSQIREFIDLLAEQFAELVHTSEGSEVACNLIALANAKERKIIIRSLKNHTNELIKNEYGNTVLITLFMTVDDTVLLHKSFSAEIFTNELLPGLIQDKFSRRPMLYLLKGLDGKYFSPIVKKTILKYEELAYKKTSKKPQEIKRTELATKAIPLIYKAILSTTNSEDPEKTLEKLLSNNMAAQFITELILTSADVEEVNNNLRPELINAIFERTVQGDVLEDYHLLNKAPYISRLLKALIQGNEFKWDNEAKKLISTDSEKINGTGSEFAERIADEVLDNNKLKSWTSGQPAFVLVSVAEVLQLAESPKFQEIQKALKKNKKHLSEDDKGAKLLLELI